MHKMDIFKIIDITVLISFETTLYITEESGCKNIFNISFQLILYNCPSDINLWEVPLGFQQTGVK
jgi:hypothetical protein